MHSVCVHELVVRDLMRFLGDDLVGCGVLVLWRKEAFFVGSQGGAMRVVRILEAGKCVGDDVEVRVAAFERPEEGRWVVEWV